MNFRIRLSKHFSIGPSGLRFKTKHGSIGQSGLLLHGKAGSVWLPAPKSDQPIPTSKVCALCQSKKRLWVFEKDRIMCEKCAKRELNDILVRKEAENRVVVSLPGCDRCNKPSKSLHLHQNRYKLCKSCMDDLFIFPNAPSNAIM